MTTKSDFSKEDKYIDLCLDKGIDFTNRIITLDEDIDEGHFNLFEFALSKMEKESKKAITIKINSDGGCTYTTFAIIARLQESKCQIVTKCYGRAFSAAFLLLASGDKRLMSKHAWGMHHSCNYELKRDKNPNHKITVEQTDREELEANVFLAEHSNIELESWSKMSEFKDHYFSAEECLEMGVIDEIY